MKTRLSFGHAARVILTALLAGVMTLAAAQTLRMGTATPVQLDPTFASADSEILVLSNVYDYLVDVNEDNEPVMQLASSYDVSPDGTVWTFTLRDGVTYHSGATFGPEDVVATFKRLSDPEAELPTSDLYANIESIEATGALEVTFTLTNPNPFFLYDLSDNHAVVVDADATDLGGTFDGTGPFRVASYEPEDRMRLERNDAYFGETPGVDTLELVFFADQSAAVNAMRGGQLDAVLRMSTPLYQSLEGASGIDRLAVSTNAFDLVRLRTDRAPGNDPRVVEALKLAVDRDVIREVVTGGAGGVAQDTPIGPLYGAYHDPSATPPAQDADRARELLAEAGYEDGLALTLNVPDSGDRPDLAVVLKEQLDAAGFDIDVQVQPESVYYGENGWLEVDFGITGWGSRPTPQFYLETMVACDAVWNEAHYCNPAVDALIDEAGTTLDEDARIAAYAEIQSILASEGPYVIPYFFQQFGAISDSFDGFNLQAFPGRTNLESIALR
jgi:peptide/nickel transport system substrate-binding protein